MKNFGMNWPALKRLWASKTFLCMRLTFYVLLLAVVQGFAVNNSYSQSTKLNLEIKNSTVRDVLIQIEEESEFYFLYNSKIVDVERKVDVSVKNKKIDEVLDVLFDNTNVDYTIVDRQIVLSVESKNGVDQEKKVTGKITIADADIVVSAGRGLKGPENWGMIEELAEVLGAATACSKPVSDLGWRPHGEHVGQTGKPVASNLYIAIGISGAIQHLAGINASKVKVVINTDPEAPFFKAADYGIVGDAFDVVPKLIEKLKAFKAS